MELDVGSLSVEELCDVLSNKGLSEEVVKAIETNKVGGRAFLALTDEHIKEMFPLIGERIAVKQQIVDFGGRAAEQTYQGATEVCYNIL